MNELQLLNKYMYSSSSLDGAFDMVSQAIYSKNERLLKLDECRAHINEIFDYLETHNRFLLLSEKSDNKLLLRSDHFELDKHKFDTLDEVEKAIKIKAFL